MGRARIGRLAIAILVVGSAVAYLVYAGTRANLTYYYEVDELLAAEPTDEEIRISGDVVEGSVERLAGERTIGFAIRGTGSASQVPIVYSGTVPDIFRPGIQVVVEGRMGSDGTFRAETLLAKCPSKYQAAGDLDSPDPPTSR